MSRKRKKKIDMFLLETKDSGNYAVSFTNKVGIDKIRQNKLTPF